MSEVGGVPQDERVWTLTNAVLDDYGDLIVIARTGPVLIHFQDAVDVQPVSVAAGLRTENSRLSLLLERACALGYIGQADAGEAELRKALNDVALLAEPDARASHSAKVRHLKSELAERDRQLEQMRPVLEALGPCDQWDHHGYCQTHFIEKPCRVAVARAALSVEPDTSRPDLPEGQPSGPSDTGNDQ